MKFTNHCIAAVAASLSLGVLAQVPAQAPPESAAHDPAAVARVARYTGDWKFKSHRLTRAEVDQYLSKPGSALFLDLRRPDELIQFGSFPVFLSIQNRQLASSLDWLPRDTPIITVSNHAQRAGAAADLLTAHGFKVIGATGSEEYEVLGGTGVVHLKAPPARGGERRVRRTSLRRPGMSGDELSHPARPAGRGTTPDAPADASFPHVEEVWDLPLRVFHWSLVTGVVGAIVTGFVGGPWMPWHGRAGLLVLGLLVFRALWGFAGSQTARFLDFAPWPSRLRRYFKGHWDRRGHNPLGALSVFGMLAWLAVVVSTGLFGNDDIAYTGPLNAWIGDDLGSRLTGWHRVMAYGLLGLLGLHLAAIVFHERVKNHRLVGPMVTGRRGHAGVGAPALVYRRGALALSLAAGALSVLAVLWAGEHAYAAPSASTASTSTSAPAAVESTPEVPVTPSPSPVTSKPAAPAAPSW